MEAVFKGFCFQAGVESLFTILLLRTAERACHSEQLEDCQVKGEHMLARSKQDPKIPQWKLWVFPWQNSSQSQN